MSIEQPAVSAGLVQQSKGQNLDQTAAERSSAPPLAISNAASSEQRLIVPAAPNPGKGRDGRRAKNVSDSDLGSTIKMPSAELVKLIRKHHALAVSSGVAGFLHQVICGHALLRAKEELGLKAYRSWLLENISHVSRRTVQRYERAASELWPRACGLIAADTGEDATAVSQLPPGHALALVSPSQASEIIVKSKTTVNGDGQPQPTDSHARSELAEWLTPSAVLRELVVFQETIDIDVCASHSAPFHIPALHRYTLVEDGLSPDYPWHGRIFVNPGHSGPIAAWVRRAVCEAKAGTIEEAVLLLPAITDAPWINDIQATHRAFLRERPTVNMAGSNKSRKLSVPLMLALISQNPRSEQFAECFGRIADIFVPHRL